MDCNSTVGSISTTLRLVPAEVLVVESKWSASAWPLNGPGRNSWRLNLARPPPKCRKTAERLATSLPSPFRTFP